MEVCKTDLQKIVKYLEDYASLCDNTKGQRYVSRAWCIRQLVDKLKRILSTNK